MLGSSRFVIGNTRSGYFGAMPESRARLLDVHRQEREHQSGRHPAPDGESGELMAWSARSPVAAAASHCRVRPTRSPCRKFSRLSKVTESVPPAGQAAMHGVSGRRFHRQSHRPAAQGGGGCHERRAFAHDPQGCGGGHPVKGIPGTAVRAAGHRGHTLGTSTMAMMKISTVSGIPTLKKSAKRYLPGP